LRFFPPTFVVLFLTALLPGIAHALAVQVNAPKELKPILERYLDTARAARLDEELTEEELLRLQQASLETARELLATEGYFSPRITSTVEGAGADRVLRYDVEAGPRTLIGAVDVRFEGAIVDAHPAGADPDRTSRRNQRLRERIERDFKLNLNKPFRQADWDAAKQAALRPLLQNTYPAARLVASEAKIDPTQHASLSLVVDSGPPFFYGPVQISGTQRYPASMIEALNPTDPGEPYRQRDLQDYQQRLDASGYFSLVIVAIEPDPALASAVPIQVTVTERPAQQLSFGVGYSTDTGERVQATYLHRNIFGEGQRLRLDGRLESKSNLALAELAWPRTARGYENRASLAYEQQDIEGQETESWKAVISRNRRRDRIDATASLQYQVENQVIGTTVDEQNEALSLGYAWTHRSAGRAFYPVRGHIANLQANVASDALLSDTSFLRLYGRYTEFFRIGAQGRLILRGEVGAVLADQREGIPTDFLFRAGGVDSVRGYDYQSLGLEVPGGVESVRNLATASVEYNYFFTPTWGAALFADAGDAADSFDQLSPVFGIGVGARYKSPIGPINVDLSYGEATGDVLLQFQFGVTF
jgi:translocation and assembly module TamA